MLNDSVAFRFDVNTEVGLGHLKRCIAIQEYVSQFAKVSMIVGGQNREEYIKDNDAQYSYIHIPKNISLLDEVEYLEENNLLPMLIVLDLTHANNLEKNNDFYIYVNGLSERGMKVIIIDGLGDYTLIKKAGLHADLIVRPYCGAEIIEECRYINQLIGAEYFVFHKKYIGMQFTQKTTELDHDNKKILLTFGGSDPEFLTKRILGLLLSVNYEKLDVRIVIGPAFDDGHIKQIQLLTQNSSHVVAFLTKQNDLLEHMLWCDFAICATGLTKYELALTRTPSIQFSIDDKHHMANKGFATFNTAIDLGVAQFVTDNNIMKSIHKLITDDKLRNTMINNCLKTVDVHGGRRLSEEIKKLIFC